MWRPNSVRRQLTWVLLLGCITLRAAYAQERQTVAQLAGKIDNEFAAIETASSSDEAPISIPIGTVTTPEEINTRVIDLIVPIGFGQRAVPMHFER